jgi:hypothetical protein
MLGLPQLHAGIPKASQNILLKWLLPHWYFARKKPFNPSALLGFRKSRKFRTSAILRMACAVSPIPVGFFSTASISHCAMSL